MADAVPAAEVALDDPFARLTGNLAGTTRMRLRVVESRRLTPGMQRLTLTAPELAGLRYRPGQDLMLMVAVDGNRPLRRRYTIRALDRGRERVTLDVVRHSGDGPGERWVGSAGPGDQIEAIAPRGKVFLDEAADWHLFAGDQAALPAFCAMAEALPATGRAVVIVEVPGPGEQVALSAAAEVSVVWLHRGERPAGGPDALAAAVSQAGFPAGHGHAYLAGEARVVLALREALAGRGFAPGQISPKAYWGRGRSNASHGEPARDG